jgi:hypothetical protein
VAHPISVPHKRFARALSAAVAHRMKRDGMTCIYDVVKLLPPHAGIPPQTVYSALYVSNRPSVWVMHYVAVALGTTLTTLIEEARDILVSGLPFQTAGEVFKGVKPSGRKEGPQRDEKKRWLKRVKEGKAKKKRK